jgi:hypothetical protein
VDERGRVGFAGGREHYSPALDQHQETSCRHDTRIIEICQCVAGRTGKTNNLALNSADVPSLVSGSLGCDLWPRQFNSRRSRETSRFNRSAGRARFALKHYKSSGRAETQLPRLFCVKRAVPTGRHKSEELKFDLCTKSL